MLVKYTRSRVYHTMRMVPTKPNTSLWKQRATSIGRKSICRFFLTWKDIYECGQGRGANSGPMCRGLLLNERAVLAHQEGNIVRIM